MIYLKYLRYLLRHKWFVWVAGLETGAPVWRLLVHDWSKFLPSEFVPYARWFNRPHTPATELAFNRAWLLHQNRQPHHWQFFLLVYDRGVTEPLEMPAKIVREMVADWVGAGRAITGERDCSKWYDANRGKMILHPGTRAKVEQLIGNLQLVHEM